VSVVVIDCTLTGAPPPTGTMPTMIWRLCRRAARRRRGTPDTEADSGHFASPERDRD
jgi:hypothetical protein